jgi:hypothetical protein
MGSCEFAGALQATTVITHQASDNQTAQDLITGVRINVHFIWLFHGWNSQRYRLFYSRFFTAPACRRQQDNSVVARTLSLLLPASTPPASRATEA